MVAAKTLRRLSYGLVFCLLVSVTPLPGQDTWYAAYERALENISVGRWEEAVADLERAVSLKPDPELNARTYGVWRRNYLPYYQLGLAHYNLGNYETASDYFNRSLAAGEIKNSPETLQLLRGYQKAIAEKMGTSQRELEEKIATEMEKGLELEREGNFQEALAKFEAVLTLDPEHKEAAEHLEIIKKEQEKQDNLARQKQAVDMTLAQGISHLEAGDLAEALACFEEVLKLEPTQPKALTLRKQVKDRLDRLAKEENLKQQRINELLREGIQLFESELWDEALIRFDQVLRIDPTNSEALKYRKNIAALIDEIQRRKEQKSLLDEASRLILHDSLISARDKLLQVKQLGSSYKADSLLALLENRFTENERLRKIRGLPQLVLNLPADSTLRLRRQRTVLSGTAINDDGIKRISMILNGQERDVFLSPVDSLPVRASFEETLVLSKGLNRIELLVFDREQQILSVSRSVFYRPPFWRDPIFMTILMLILVLSGGAFLYYKRNIAHMLLTRFRRRPFEIIVPNPFIVGNPIRSREMFFGREDDFRFVKNKVDNEKYGSLIVLFGERRAGKTSVLYQILGGRLGPNYMPVFIDMQAMAINNDNEFLERIAELTAEAVRRYNIDFKISGFENRSKNPYTLFDKFIDKVLVAIGQSKLLFLIDEYELIEDKVAEGKIKKDIFLFLSGLVEHKAGLFFIFAGNHRLQDRDKSYWQSLLQRCDYRNISYLTPNDTRRLIHEPVWGKVFYLGSSVRSIMTLTAGQPFYTQLICRNIVEMLNTEKRNYFYEEDISAVVREIIDNPPPQMIYFWAGLTPPEKVTLSIIAELSKNVNQFQNLKEIVGGLNKSSLSVSTAAIKKACENMLRREILEQNTKDAYRFRMDLFRLWIREEHNLYKVSREIEHQFAS
ncbi:MAG TPA: tetratricopeptide repeat protein [archaeon]|nr:tetratricopeptide repeat protein [archaeon]